MVLAAVEGGGTKFVAGLVRLAESGRPEILCRHRVPTTSPEATLGEVIARLRPEMEKAGGAAALGVGCFGPLVLDREDPAWGRVAVTPKPGWQDADVAGILGTGLGLPVALDTDVNAAAWGEGLWGAARGLHDYVYITVGTGIGAGVVSGGGLVHGLGHPELGHIRLAREPGDGFPGICRHHGDCFEGICAGPALAARAGRPAEELPEGHEAWGLEARYVARAVAACCYILAPRRVILGGGVGSRPGLLAAARDALTKELAGYLPALASAQAVEAFLVGPGLGSDSGFLGAAALAASLSGGA